MKEFKPDTAVAIAFIAVLSTLAALFCAFLALKLMDARADWALQRACRSAGQRVVVEDRDWHCSGPVPAERP